MKEEIHKVKKYKSIPLKYVEGLSLKDREKRVKELKESHELYKINKKASYISADNRTKFPLPHKRSRWTIAFEKKYGENILRTAPSKLFEKLTHISVKAQKEIIKKGRGAFVSSGSRPNQTSDSWAYARLASVAMGGPARKVDGYLLVESPQ
jgi:hypothetical protein